MADNKSIEDRARRTAQSRPENGREFEQYQGAQNQLLEIQAAQKQNLMEQRMAGNSMANENAILRQAAELQAANMQVNQATQNTMGRYGLQKPQTISTRKQTQTQQQGNVIITNNTTNITTVPANIGGPIQGRPLQFQAGSTAAETNNFKNWISKAFDRQNEEAKKREREYSRRETSLTKSSNKIMRKLEEFSKDITKKLDPRNIGRSVGGQIGTIFKLFGMGYLAANTEKILDGIKKFADGGKELFSWIKGEKKETPAFIRNLTESFSSAFGKVIFGDKVSSEEIKRNGIFWGFYNKDGTGVLNQFFSDLGEKLSERSKLAAANAKMNKMSLKEIKDNPIGAIKEVAGYLTEYLSILVGGEKAVGKVSQSNFESEAEGLVGANSQIKDANAIRKRAYNPYTEGVLQAGAGASAYVTNGNPYVGNYNLNNGSNYRSYGNKAATWLSPTALDIKGRLTMGEESSLSLFSDMQATLVNKKKAGSFERFIRDSRLAEQYLNTHEEGLIADPNTLKALLGDDYKLDLKNHLVVKRRKTIKDKYPASVIANRLGQQYILASTAGQVMKGVGRVVDVVGIVSIFVPGIGWGFAIGCAAASGLCKLLGNKEAIVGLEAARIAGEENREKADYEIGFPRLTVNDLRAYWLVYGNFHATLTSETKPEEAKAIINDLKRGKNIKIPIEINGRDIEIGPRGDNYKDLIGDWKEVGVSDNGTKLVQIELNNSFQSLLSEDYLNVFIRLAELGIIQSTQLAAYTKDTHEALKQKYGQGDTAAWSTGNLSGLKGAADTWAAIGGHAPGSALGQLEEVDATGYDYNDNFMSYGASGYGYAARGETSAVSAGRSQAKKDIAAGMYSDRGSSGNISTASTTSPTEPNAFGEFNIQKAVDFLAAHAHDESTGWCARNVRAAMEAGGLNTTGRPGYGGAYGNWLTSHGWEEVSTDEAPKAGDVEVLDPQVGWDGRYHEYGHIQMWGGDTWYSDFKQNDSGNAFGAGHSRRKRYRYKGSDGTGIIHQTAVGSEASADISGSPYPGKDMNSQTLEGAGILEIAKAGLGKIWNRSKAVIREKADGTLVEMVGTQKYINGIIGRETPVDPNYKPLNGMTREIMRKYSSADYVGGGASIIDKYGINYIEDPEKRMSESRTRKILSSLFDEKGNLRVNTVALDPKLEESLKTIEAELKKGNELDIAQIELSAEGIDASINANRSMSVATQQAWTALAGGGSKPQAPSQANETVVQ